MILSCCRRSISPNSALLEATLISPFVGRITDYWKAQKGVEGFAASEDPGVLSVQEIYNYYKTHNYSTVVMGASFRNKEQVLELAVSSFVECTYFRL